MKPMRLDKFLKVSRLIKRRRVAKEFCDSQRIRVNNQFAKASKELKTEDTIEIRYGTKIIHIQVKKLMDSTKTEDAPEMYEILSVSNKVKES